MRGDEIESFQEKRIFLCFFFAFGMCAVGHRAGRNAEMQKCRRILKHSRSGNDASYSRRRRLFFFHFYLYLVALHHILSYFITFHQFIHKTAYQPTNHAIGHYREYRDEFYNIMRFQLPEGSLVSVFCFILRFNDFFCVAFFLAAFYKRIVFYSKEKSYSRLFTFY